ncbi:MAG: CBS domain-containing protein [Halobacteria archaeon]|nr:CBS domain-containing protein [Halobacteria archaeon]
MDLPTPERLRETRKSLGLTQDELAEMADVSQPLIARIENDDVDPRFSTLRRIIDVLESVEEEQNVKGESVTAEDLMTTGIISVSPDDTVKEVVDTLQETGYSQLPVIEDDVPVGSVTDALIAHARSEIDDLPDAEVSEVMDESFPTVSPNVDVDTLSSFLDGASAVLVTTEGCVEGIVTDADIAAYFGRSESEDEDEHGGDGDDRDDE